MREGEPAPFTGDLYPVEESVRMALEADTCAERAALNLQRLSDRHRVELEKLAAIQDATARSRELRIELLRNQLASETAWHRSPAFVASVSVVVSVAVLLTSAFLLQATAEAGR